MQKSNLRPLNASSVSVLPKAMLVASWPLASRSDLQIAYDCGLYSWPYRLSLASGFCASRCSSARASMPPVPAVGSYSVRTMPASVRSASFSAKSRSTSSRIASRGV